MDILSLLKRYRIQIARVVAGVLNVILFFGAFGSTYFAGTSLFGLLDTFGMHRSLGLLDDLPGMLMLVLWLALLALALLPLICAVLWLVLLLPRGLAFVFQIAHVFLTLAGWGVMWFVSSRITDILGMLGMPVFGSAGTSPMGGYLTQQLVLGLLAIVAGIVALAFRAPGGVVTCEKGVHAGQSFKLERGDSLVFGRNVSACDVVFPAECIHVSRQHCTVTLLSGGRRYLVECHSSNGMLVDGAACARNQAVMAKRGSTIALEGGTDVYRLGQPSWFARMIGGAKGPGRVRQAGRA